MKILILLILSFTVLARDTIYLAPHLGATYASNSDDAYASSLGSHIGITGGLRQGRYAFEVPLCEGYGLQTPRDITDLHGTNAWSYL